MIKKRLLGLVPESTKYIIMNVIFQWLGMCSNVIMVYTIAYLLLKLIGLQEGSSLAILVNGGTEASSKGLLNSLFGSLPADETTFYMVCAAIILLTALVRILCVKLASTASYNASRSVKRTLRGMLYEKLLRLGTSYTEHVSTAEVVQLAGEGVEQLETYFGQYMPQFFYAFLAPITLFFVVRPISVKVAVVLLVCVPLIPIAIVVVQKIAKRLLKNYWGQYALLGDHFLENLQGLTTLKIYQADEKRHEEINTDAEHFRKITMKVLTMQLNSIIVMDVVAYGGAALGILLASLGFVNGDISFTGCFVIILLSADFFLPMRKLGSFFHVAMNGMTASDKIFAILDLPEEAGKNAVPASSEIVIRDLHFGYSEEKEILHGVSMEFPEGSFTAIVGESGCGKSTVAGILTGRNKGYTGDVSLGGELLSDVAESELMKRITLISHNSYIFKGTLKDNLLLGKPDATDEELYAVLEKVNLLDFVKSGAKSESRSETKSEATSRDSQIGGLDMPLMEGGSNLSGGQRQRLALARAILHDSPVYIFDEATSNIDVESENDIMKLIIAMTEKGCSEKECPDKDGATDSLKEKKSPKRTVILISHRLANVVKADRIYVMESGNVVQSGNHEQLLGMEEDKSGKAAGGTYKKLWDEQQALENMLKEGADNE